jgi:AcrR family transcriptional regulator
MSAAPADDRRFAQRARILDAAAALFAARGFEAVTMSEVARAAGVARATVFNHFGSKRALVEAITEGVVDYYAGMLERALACEGRSTPALARALFEQMGLGIQEFHRFHQGIFREIMKLQVGLEEGGAVARAHERSQERLERLLARGQQRGELSRDFTPTELAHAFTSLANGTIHHWLYDDSSGSLRDRMRRAAEIFLGAIAIADAPDEPLPDLVSGTPSFPAPRVVPLPRARSRRKP